MLHLAHYHDSEEETVRLLERAGFSFNHHGTPIFPVRPEVTRAIIMLGNMIADVIIEIERQRDEKPDVVVVVNSDRQQTSATALANVIIARIDEKLDTDLDRVIVSFGKGSPLVENDHGIHVDKNTPSIIRGRRMLLVTDLLVRNGFVARTIKSALAAVNQGTSLDRGNGAHLITGIAAFVVRDKMTQIDNGHMGRFGFMPEIFAFLNAEATAPNFASSAELPVFPLDSALQKQKK